MKQNLWSIAELFEVEGEQSLAADIVGRLEQKGYSFRQPGGR